MPDKIILCRRDSSDIGAPHDYCCQPIRTASSLNWCDDCLARLPFWPIDGVPQGREQPQ